MRRVGIGKLELALLLFLVGAFAAFWFIAQKWAGMAHAWAVGDWLISYESGFVRRGSIGTVIFGLNDVTGLSLTTLVLLFHLALYAVLAGVIGYFCLTKRLSFPVLLLIVSPACLLFPILDVAGGGGRKEMLHFALFGIWCVILCRARSLPWSLVAVFAGLVALATTAHEMFLFLSAFYSAAYAARSRQLGLQPSVLKMGAIPAAALFLSGLIFIFGTGASVDAPQELCQAIVERGLPVSVCGGAVFYPSGLMVNLEDTWTKIVTTFGYIHFMPHLLLLSFLPLALVAADASEEGRKVRSVLWPSIFAALPLFLMALDWGRWVHIIIVSSLLLMMLAAPIKTESQGAAILEPRDIVRPISLTVTALCYMLFWSIPHCCTTQFSNNGLIRILGALS